MTSIARKHQVASGLLILLKDQGNSANIAWTPQPPSIFKSGTSIVAQRALEVAVSKKSGFVGTDGQWTSR